MNYFIDAHCHLHEPWFENDIEQVIYNAKAHNVKKIVNCSSDPTSFDQVINSTQLEDVYCTIGLQPTQADEVIDASEIRKKLDTHGDIIIAIGEVGLDYYWVKEEELRDRQEILFKSCIELSNEFNLPIVVHSRKAESECLDLLEKYADTPVLLHSFDGNLNEINRAIDLGYLITVPTIVTRRKNRRKVTQRAGLDNIMIETDAPFMAPEKEIERNEPAYIPLAANKIAELLETDIDDVANTTSKNAENYYGI